MSEYKRFGSWLSKLLTKILVPKNFWSLILDLINERWYVTDSVKKRYLSDVKESLKNTFTCQILT